MRKSGALGACGGRRKHTRDKSSQGKAGEETAKDEHLLNGSEDHRDTVDIPCSFNLRPSPPHQENHAVLKVLAMIGIFFKNVTCSNGIPVFMWLLLSHLKQPPSLLFL